MFQTALTDAPSAVEPDDDLDEPVREAPDVSHVAPPPAELPPTRDEALELLARRLDIMATRADRLERSVEYLAPPHIQDMPSRAEMRALEAAETANRERGELLDRRITELRQLESQAVEERAADRATMAELSTAIGKLEAKLRDFTEELIEVRATRESSAESMRELREALFEADAVRTAEISRRLASAYTISFVALLAALLTLGLLLFR